VIESEKMDRQYNNKERKECVLARKIDLENHVKTPIPLLSVSLGLGESPNAMERSAVSLGDSLDFVLLPHGIRVSTGAL